MTINFQYRSAKNKEHEKRGNRMDKLLVWADPFDGIMMPNAFLNAGITED